MLDAISHNAVPFVVCVGFRILASCLFWLFFFNIINKAKAKPVTERKKKNYALSPTLPRAPLVYLTRTRKRTVAVMLGESNSIVNKLQFCSALLYLFAILMIIMITGLFSITVIFLSSRRFTM